METNNSLPPELTDQLLRASVNLFNAIKNQHSFPELMDWQYWLIKALDATGRSSDRMWVPVPYRPKGEQVDGHEV